MKIAYCSDLHLEVGDIQLDNKEDAKVLILAGDICTVTDLDELHAHSDKGFFRSQRIHDFFSNCCDEFENVIYIMGNHEHYHFEFDKTLETLRHYLRYLPNLHILEKEIITIGDTKFVCGTLWSDCNNGDEQTKSFLKTRMNDFRVIYNGGTRFTPNDAIEEHNKTLQFISSNNTGDQEIIVVGHHSPSFKSVSEEFAGDKLMNGGFHSELSDFIINNPQIKYWVHGHTHSNHDYMIGNTRVICNPRGYTRYEKIADTFKLKYFGYNS